MKRLIKPKETTEVAKQIVNKKRTLTEKKIYDGSTDVMVSTGSTTLDLAISGGRVRGGGIPGGIFVEIFGPSGAGKTVLLCEIAGDVQRKGGDAMFQDPEARLNKQFARIFDLELKDEYYTNPDKVPEIFKRVRDWDPVNPDVINGVFIDSLAALSTDIEMDNDDGDKMGMRRAKEFSEGLRKNARIMVNKNYLMVCSNQIRESQATHGPTVHSPGGRAIGFYSSLRLRAMSPVKFKKKKTIAGKEVERVVGVMTEFEVFKSSVWAPHRKATVYILFDYGIDDIRANLQFIKDHTSNNVYTVGELTLNKSIEKSIQLIENDPDLIHQLKEQVIDLWESIEEKFKMERKPKQR